MVGRKAGRGNRSTTPFMKKIINNTEKTKYKKRKVAMVNRDEWLSV